MIKAQDLRIGNLVFCDGKAREVLNVGISGVGMRLEYGGLLVLIKYEEIQPIPLTPELLEKAGFEGSNDTFAIDLYKKGEVRWALEMCLIIDLKEPATYINNTGGDGMLRYNVQYLHQLQNLFYCLTGQELEINL